MTRRAGNYPIGVRSQAVRMVSDCRGLYASETQAIRAVAEELGIHSPESIRRWLRQAEIDAGIRAGTSSAATAEAGERRREDATTARAAAIRAAAGPLLQHGTRPSTPRLVAFIATHTGRAEAGGLPWSAESICAVLTDNGAPIAASTYYAARAARPTASEVRDEYLLVKIAQVRAELGRGYGARRVWSVLNDRGVAVARCTVERLLRELVQADEMATDDERAVRARRLAS